LGGGFETAGVFGEAVDDGPERGDVAEGRGVVGIVAAAQLRDELQEVAVGGAGRSV